MESMNRQDGIYKFYTPTSLQKHPPLFRKGGLNRTLCFHVPRNFWSSAKHKSAIKHENSLKVGFWRKSRKRPKKAEKPENDCFWDLAKKAEKGRFGRICPISSRPKPRHMRNLGKFLTNRRFVTGNVLTKAVILDI